MVPDKGKVRAVHRDRKMKNIVWLNLFLIAFPTTLFILIRDAEAKSKGFLLDLLQNGKLLDLSTLTNLFHLDKAANLEIEALVKYYGYPIETHRFYSSDGYLTTLHRIPHGRTSTQRGGFPVLLQHGVATLGTSWIHAGLSSLPLLLADRGFDVFIASQRGTGYSLGHKKYKITDNAYWNFGMYEIATIEIPAYVDYILALTGAPKVHYVGFSLGTMLLFQFLSARPEYNDKIDKISLMGVAGYFSNTRSPLFRILYAVGPTTVKGALDLGFSGGFLMPKILVGTLLSPLCRIVLGPLVCSSTYLLLTGDNAAHSNQTRIGRYLQHTTSMSGNIVVQLLQWMKSGRIAQFDYGKRENIKRYGSPVPPVYNLGNIRRPLQAFIGASDMIATKGDAYKTLKEIGPYFVNPETSLVRDPLFNHADFMLHDDIINLIYKDVINFFITGEPTTKNNYFGSIKV